MELAVCKSQLLSKGMSLDTLKDRAARIIESDESLESLRPLLDSADDHEVFTVEGFKGLGVPTGTPDIDSLDILKYGKVVRYTST